MSRDAYEQREWEEVRSEIRIIRSMISHIVPVHICQFKLYDAKQHEQVCLKCGLTPSQSYLLTTASNAGEAAQGEKS